MNTQVSEPEVSIWANKKFSEYLTKRAKGKRIKLATFEYATKAVNGTQVRLFFKPATQEYFVYNGNTVIYSGLSMPFACDAFNNIRQDEEYRGGTLRYRNEDGTYTIVEIGSPLFSLQSFMATEVYYDDIKKWMPIYEDSENTEDKTTISVAPVKYVCSYIAAEGHVVWQDVFGDNRPPNLESAIKANKVATFVTEQDARDYCDYRNSASDGNRVIDDPRASIRK